MAQDEGVIMAYPSPVSWSSIENALYDFVSSSTGLTTIWAKQKMPQPAKPYAVLDLIGGLRVDGRDELRQRQVINNDLSVAVLLDLAGQRRVRFNIQVLTDNDRPGFNAQHYLGIAQAAIRMLPYVNNLNTAGIAVLGVGNVLDLDNIAGAGYQSRASMDLDLRVAANVAAPSDTDSGWIEEAELIDEINT